MREATLRAALEQLLARGYDGLNMADVAAQAGVAVTTVYRRWPTKPQLVAAALGELAAAENPMPDTGTLEGDLLAMLAQVVDLLRRPEVQRLARAFAAIDPQTPGVDEARAAFWGTRFSGSAELVRRAIDRGELPPATEPERLIEFLVAPAYLRVLVTRLPLDDALVQTSVRTTIAAHVRD